MFLSVKGDKTKNPMKIAPTQRCRDYSTIICNAKVLRLIYQNSHGENMKPQIKINKLSANDFQIAMAATQKAFPRMKAKSFEMAKSVMVDGFSPAETAQSFDVTRQAVEHPIKLINKVFSTQVTLMTKDQDASYVVTDNLPNIPEFPSLNDYLQRAYATRKTDTGKTLASLVQSLLSKNKIDVNLLETLGDTDREMFIELLRNQVRKKLSDKTKQAILTALAPEKANS